MGNLIVETKNKKLSDLMERIAPYRASVLEHSVYQVSDIASLQEFMKSHVFAVWDNMTLLKALQCRLTCIELPWLPPLDMSSARLVNEIVLVEESDEIASGHYLSHADFYILAMKEIGADSTPIEDFISFLRLGMSSEQALEKVNIPESTKEFVLHTLKTSQGFTHEVADSFLLGREDIATPMFQSILTKLKESKGIHYDTLHRYIDRHTHIDEEQHSPMAQKLLKNLCGTDDLKWSQAFEAAKSALEARKSLWDGINRCI